MVGRGLAVALGMDATALALSLALLTAVAGPAGAQRAVKHQGSPKPPAAPQAVAPTPPPPPPSDVWLDCRWHETWKSTTLLGATSRAGTSEHDYSNIYLFSPKDQAFFLYQPDHSLYRQRDAVIGATAIMIDTQDHYESLGHQSKSRRLWTVSRQDLKVDLIGSSDSGTQLDDGRIISNSILMSGAGACSMTEPKPIAIPAPNKF